MGRFTLPSENNSNFQYEKKSDIEGNLKQVREQSITKGQDGKAALQSKGSGMRTQAEEEKSSYDNRRDNNKMVGMKPGDEDLVEDEAVVMSKNNSKSPYADQSENREDININESTAEQKVTGSIPMLKNNKNSLIRNTKPFSQRLKTGELNIDVNDIYAVANQMIFEVNLLAGKTLGL